MNELPESSYNGDTLESLDYLLKSPKCLLLPTTPSSATLDFDHPLSDQMNDASYLEITEDNKLQNNDTLAGDTSSSGDSNSVVQDPVSAQLINNISMLDYQTLSKTGDSILGQNDDVKLNGNVNVVNRKLPGFVNWNWNLIRKVLLWVVLSGLIACMGAIIAMILSIPKVCNPNLPWHQGKVFYEVFVASYKDSNNDGIGDLKGLIKNLVYIEELGVSAIRLNNIYESEQYPERYFNTTSLLKIDRSIGTIQDFQDLVKEVHTKNISIVLDIPVTSMMSTFSPKNWNTTNTVLVTNDSSVGYADPTTAAITYWAKGQNVDGFYLKNLEQYVQDPNFSKSLQTWKKIIGQDKILIASHKCMENVQTDNLNVFLSRIDLIDVHIDLKKGTNALKTKIEDIINGALWSKPHYPWIHWNIGNVNSDRISTDNINNSLVLTALELILPGTISIFYGDEIGLGGLPSHEIESDFHEHQNIKNLVPMIWKENNKNNPIHAWNFISVLEPQYHYLEVIKILIKLRLETSTIYLNSIFKEGNVLKNAGIRKTDNDLVIVERWYPRKNTCVFVGNFGNKSVTTDLTSMFYGGTVVGGTNTTLIGETVYFHKITFPPYSAIVLKMEK